MSYNRCSETTATVWAAKHGCRRGHLPAIPPRQLCRFGEVRLAPSGIAKRTLENSTVVIGDPIRGIQTNGLVEVGHGAVGIALSEHVRLGAVDISILVPGIEPDRPIEIAKGATILMLLVVVIAAVVIGVGVAWIDPDGLVVVGDGARALARRAVNNTASAWPRKRPASIRRVQAAIPFLPSPVSQASVSLATACDSGIKPASVATAPIASIENRTVSPFFR
jgi:hypothetical protein